MEPEQVYFIFNELFYLVWSLHQSDGYKRTQEYGAWLAALFPGQKL